MSLEDRKLELLLDKIEFVDISDQYDGAVKTLFNYLAKNVSATNSVYQEYIDLDHSEWYNSISPRKVTMPDDYEIQKQVSFYIYKKIADSDKNGFARSVAITIFMRKNNLENLSLFSNLFISNFREVITDILDGESSNGPDVDEEVTTQVINLKKETILKESSNSQTVFLIHGHDSNLLKEVKVLLSDAEVKYIVLHQIPDGGRTVIEKLESEAKPAGYAIALFTPDDLMQDDTARARQNVLLETGFFIGLLGRSKVRMVIRDETQIPSDLTGILFTKYDSSLKWKASLLQELAYGGIIIKPQNMMPH